MAGVDIYFTALDRCRTAMVNGANDFEDLLGSYPAKTIDTSVFAGATGSISKENAGVAAMAKAVDALAKVIDNLEGSVAGEGVIVTKNLRETERALDDVETNIRKADKAGEA
jgi:hypothetical protein